MRFHCHFLLFVHYIYSNLIFVDGQTINANFPRSDIVCSSSSTSCYISCRGCRYINIVCPYDPLNPDSCQICQITCLENGCLDVTINSTNCAQVTIIGEELYSLGEKSVVYAPGLSDSSISYSNSPNSNEMKNLSFTTAYSKDPYLNIYSSTVISSKFVKNSIEFECTDADCHYIDWYIYNESILLIWENDWAWQFHNNIYMYDNSKLFLVANGSSWYYDAIFKNCTINLYDNSVGKFEANVHGELIENDIFIYDSAQFTAIARDSYSSIQECTIDARSANTNEALIDIYVTNEAEFSKNTIYCPSQGLGSDGTVRCNLEYGIDATGDSSSIYATNGVGTVK